MLERKQNVRYVKDNVRSRKISRNAYEDKMSGIP